MVLSADLKTMPATDLLQWIETTQKTGIVEFFRNGEWKKIFFQKGQILFASSSREKEKLGRFLIRKKRITDQDLSDCLEENERTGKKLTQILEDRGLISHEDLYDDVVLYVKEILYDLFLWNEGNFLFRDHNLPAAVEGPLALKTGQILFQVLTRIDERQKEKVKTAPPSGSSEAGPRACGRTRVKGRIVFKVDNKKFILPGTYEKSELPALEETAQADGPETDTE